MGTAGRRSWAGRAMAAAMAAACLGGRLELPVRASELEEDHRLSMEFVTPHTKWAQPYAGGKTRVLVFIDASGIKHWGEPYGTLPREIIELKQRFDLDAAAVYWVHTLDTKSEENWLHGQTGVERMLNLLRQPWDCYVLYQIQIDAVDLQREIIEMLPVAAQYRLLEGVAAGSGLVLVGADAKRVLKEKNRLKSLPEFLAQGTPLASLPFVQESVLKGLEPGKGTDTEAARRMMSAYRIKNGRGLRLVPRPDPGVDIGWDTQYEYWAQLVGRAVLWAAGHEPKMTLAVAVNTSACDRAGLSGQKITVEWAHPRPPPGLEIEASLRRFDGQVTPLKIKKNAAGTGTLTCGVPDLRAGRYFVDVRARSASGAESWASTTFAVTSARRVTKLELDAPYSEIGGTLSGRITLEGKPLRRERVRVDLLDSRNRIVARSDLRAAAGQVAFKFDVKPWMPMLTRVVARLLAGGREVDHQYAYFHVTKRYRGRFNLVMWDYPMGTLAPWAERALAKYGVTLHSSSYRTVPQASFTGNPPNYIAANEMGWIPYSTHIGNELDTNGIKMSMSLVGDPYRLIDETGCWNDPKVIGPRMKNQTDNFTPSRQHGVFAYSLGDEITTRGSCLSPHCLRAYRKYLEQEYGSIAAMNASWGSSYESFDEIELLDPKDNDGAEARRQGIYARWYDRQAFQRHNICRYYKAFGDAYRSMDPKSRTGFQGHGKSGYFGDGPDYDLVIRNIQWWAPVADLGDEVIRSLAPRDFPRNNWMGYSKKAETLLREYWRMVTHGSDAIGWFMWYLLDDGYHGFLAPWWGQFDATKELLADTAVVRNGLGTLLMKSQPLDDEIAILYSHPSNYATKVATGPSYGRYDSVHAFWVRALRELHLQFRYVSDRMLRLGEFNPDSAKVLVLAQAEAIGPKEAAAIRRFAEAGGTVIADVCPGIYTDRCKPRQGSVLADLFGIEPAEPAAARQATAAITGPFGDVTLKAMLCDPSVQLAGGQAHGTAGDIPIVIVNKVGEGRAVLLNFSMAGSPGMSGAKYYDYHAWMLAAPHPEASAEFLGRVLAAAGVKPALQVLNRAGGRFRNVEVRRWRNGRIRIVSLYRFEGGEEEALVELPEPRHVYNLRSGKDLGRTSSVRVPVPAHRATFLVLAPEPVPDVELKLSAGRAARGQVVRLTATVPGAAGLHAVRVRVRTPAGEIAEWLNRELMVDGRGQGFDLPVAFNDPVGLWTVEATDLYTEKITTTGYTIN